jgi:hypothetical protein
MSGCRIRSDRQRQHGGNEDAGEEAEHRDGPFELRAPLSTPSPTWRRRILIDDTGLAAGRQRGGTSGANRRVRWQGGS